MRIDPTTFEAFAALALGFAFAGLLASAFEALARRRVGLALLRTGDAAALACVPLVVFAAPVLILRDILARPARARPTAFGVMAATVVAGLWGLASGRLVLDVAHLVTGA